MRAKIPLTPLLRVGLKPIKQEMGMSTCDLSEPVY